MVLSDIGSWSGGVPVCGRIDHVKSVFRKSYPLIFLQILTAKLGLALTRAGMTVFTGGGPGAMEAVNLGARLASAPGDLDAVLASLAAVPGFQPSVDAWARVALAVCERYPDGGSTRLAVFDFHGEWLDWGR